MNKKQTNKILNFLVKESCSLGIISEKKAQKVIYAISKLPYPENIFILKEYKKRVQAIEEKYTLKIETPIKLTTREADKVAKAFQKKYKIAKIRQEINKNLIAGVKIQIGSQIFDYSMQGQIHRIRQMSTEI